MNLPCQNRRFVNDQSESKICEWSSWIENFMNESKPKILWMRRVKIADLWSIKLNRKLYEWAEIEDLWIIKLNRSEDFMNESCQNRRFVNYQAESKAKILWISRVKTHDFLLRISRSKSSKNDIDWRCLLSRVSRSKSKKNVRFSSENFKIEIREKRTRALDSMRLMNRQERVLTIKSDQKEVLYNNIWSDKDLHDKVWSNKNLRNKIWTEKTLRSKIWSDKKLRDKIWSEWDHSRSVQCEMTESKNDAISCHEEKEE
jgi:hypothetical protein